MSKGKIVFITTRPRVTIRECTVWLLFALGIAVLALLVSGCDASGGESGGDAGAPATRGEPPPPVDASPATVADAGRPPVDTLWTAPVDAGRPDACQRTCETNGEAVRYCLCPVGDGTFTSCESIPPLNAYHATCCGVPCP